VAKKNSRRVFAWLTHRSELFVEFVFECDCVVREVDGVDVEREGDGRAAEFADSVEWFESAGKPDLDDVWAKGADVGDDVDVACADVRCTVIVLRDRVGDAGELAFDVTGVLSG
jgi:hypothetical protein